MFLVMHNTATALSNPCLGHMQVLPISWSRGEIVLWGHIHDSFHTISLRNSAFSIPDIWQDKKHSPKKNILCRNNKNINVAIVGKSHVSRWWGDIAQEPPIIHNPFISPYSVFYIAICLRHTKEKSIYIQSWTFHCFPFLNHPDVSSTSER
jgi:hypothetical protein